MLPSCCRFCFVSEKHTPAYFYFDREPATTDRTFAKHVHGGRCRRRSAQQTTFRLLSEEKSQHTLP